MSDEATVTEKKAVLSADEKKLIDALEKLNVVSLNNVVKYMEEEYGISAAPAPVVAAGGVLAGEGKTADEEEKTAYDIELADTGSQKIAVIKAVREITQLGLGEAKAKVDGAPAVIKENVPKEEAEEAKKKLEEAGAKVVLK